MSAMANGRCRLHGGLSTGPKHPHSQKTHGIYDHTYTEEELAILDVTPLGHVDYEIRVLRIQLRRALELQQLMLEDPTHEKLLKCTELKTEHVAVLDEKGLPVKDNEGNQVYETKTNRVFTIPDLDLKIYRWSTRIESLERTRKELGGDGDKPEDAARKIKDALDEIEGTVPDADA
jgi:hypothetical protein